MSRAIKRFVAMAAMGGAALAATGTQAESVVAEGAEPEMISTGHFFTEGPAADDQGHLYFTDVPGAKIWHYDLEGEPTLFMENTGGVNGLWVDGDDSLLGCQMAQGRLVDIGQDKEVTVLADSYEGKALNAPNDLWPDPKGGIYFTDPRYGASANEELDGEYVFYLKPDRETLVLVDEELERPNGVIGTPDGKTLYVADHGAGKTWKYDIGEDGTLSNKTLFAEQGSDGMTLDERGNLYLTGEDVDVFSPEGEKIETITIDPNPSNLTFGGADNQTLFVTARMRVYALPMAVKGADYSE